MKTIFIFLLLATLAYAQGSGTALNFDASQHIQVPHSASIDFSTSSFTLEAWINPSDLSTNPVIIEKGSNTNNRYGLEVLADGSLCAYFSTMCDLTSPALVVAANEWAHVALVFDDTTDSLKLYHNGILVASKLEPTNPNSSSGNMVIGRSGTINAANMRGNLDEIRFWNRPLSLPEMRHKMAEKLTGSELGLVAYYRMDEGTDNSCSGGEDVCDASGNGNHGTKF